MNMSDVSGKLLASEILSVIDEEDQYCCIVGVKVRQIALYGMGSEIGLFCCMIFGGDDGRVGAEICDEDLLDLFWPTI